MWEVRQGLLVPRTARDLRGSAVPGVRLHRQSAVQEETHVSGDAGGFPLVPRAERPYAGEALSDRRALAGRRLLRPGKRLSIPTVGHQPPGEPTCEPARAEPTLRPLRRRGQRRQDGPALHDVRDDGPPRVQLPRSSGLLEGSDGRAVPSLPDGTAPPGPA